MSEPVPPTPPPTEPGGPDPAAEGPGAVEPAPHQRDDVEPPPASPAPEAPSPPVAPKEPVPALPVVRGTVTPTSPTEVEVALDDGRTGVIHAREVGVDGEPPTSLAEGEQVEAAVLQRDDPRQRVVLSRAVALKQRAWDDVERAVAERSTVAGRVVREVKGGLVVDIGVRAFLPVSLIDEQPPGELAGWVGQEVRAKVVEANRVADRVVISRRAWVRQEHRVAEREALRSLAAGQVRTGRVVQLAEFGAFVEVGGVRGLVHRTELAWGRVESVSDVVSVGDEVEVLVVGINTSRRRITLSMKQLRPDPLLQVSAGELRQGTVSRLADFGAFVRFGEPGPDAVEGLVHLTELAEHRVTHPEQVVVPGEAVMVKVLAVDPERRRIDLSLRQISWS